ncbi:MAG: cyclic nucleotide-binding domain-containing protein [Thermodesulfobacteriota bacterium]
MLDRFINNPDINKYLTRFQAGQILFLEADDSQDLYILVSGELDVLKGQKKITEIKEHGALFGEMSLFLESKRTATVRARTDVEAIVIPPDRINAVLRDSPEIVWEIGRYLAGRLQETSQVVYGLNELYDQIPDAVVLTDREGRVLSWNVAATRLYGRDWDTMRHKSVEEIYEDPGRYREYLARVQEESAVQERTLEVRHPHRGLRFISTSMNVLYDGHHNFQGVLSIGRDVTDAKKVEQRYRRIRNWVLPSILLAGLTAGGLFLGYPYLTKGYLPVDVKKQELKSQLGRDFMLLQSLIAEDFESKDRAGTSKIMREFFMIQEGDTTPYRGLVLLDEEKRVFDVYNVHMDSQELEGIIGNSYAGIQFQGPDDSIHSVLTLYRLSREHPMGYRGIEVAFKMERDDNFLGWLLFQMDTEMLEEVYKIDEEGLARFRFGGS